MAERLKSPTSTMLRSIKIKGLFRELVTTDFFVLPKFTSSFY